MGKQKKEFTLTKPNSPASKGRTYALYCAVGVDVRDTDLTNKQAHTLLDRANAGEPYQVREELLELEGARAAKQDVARELRKFKPKATKKRKSSAKAEPEKDELAILLDLLRKRPELIKAALADAAEEIEDEPEPEPKPKPKPKAKPKAATKTRKAGTKVTTKSGQQVTLNKDDTISDDDLLKLLGTAMKNAV
ncbi:MAG: hypothetical protein ACW99G_11685 [Candidatus Thorarchaeota archaeon]